MILDLMNIVLATLADWMFFSQKTLNYTPRSTCHSEGICIRHILSKDSCGMTSKTGVGA